MTLSGRSQIMVLPPSIGRLTSLMVLDLYGNDIRRLPVEIGQLRAMRRLYLDNNNIEEVPAEISNLRNLIRLYLGQNQLRIVPKQLFQMATLEELDLSNNLLPGLPQTDFELHSIKWLNLDGNTLMLTMPDPTGFDHTDGVAQLTQGDGRTVANKFRLKSYQDSLRGKMGSQFLRRIRFSKAEQLVKRLEESEVTALTAERIHKWSKQGELQHTMKRL